MGAESPTSRQIYRAYLKILLSGHRNHAFIFPHVRSPPSVRKLRKLCANKTFSCQKLRSTYEGRNVDQLICILNYLVHVIGFVTHEHYLQD